MPDHESVFAKSQLRRTLLRQRRQLTARQVGAASQAVCEQVLSLKMWQDTENILFYAPINNEINTWPLIRSGWTQGRTILFPRCRENEPGEMDLACVRSPEELQPGFKNIFEPQADLCRSPELFTLGLVFVPCVGMDRRGNRLGYGGGYYDRFLSRTQGVWVAALAYSFQILDAVPHDPWDIPVDCIITETETIWTKTTNTNFAVRDKKLS
ncbi:MAG: 5-formyltetrahydrofolate cyclo-ligase [Thermodesulfobacteriota bacterium]